MADGVESNLPNLKISIENSDESGTSASEEEDDGSSESSSASSSSSSSSEDEEEIEDVAFHVKIADPPSPTESKAKYGGDNSGSRVDLNQENRKPSFKALLDQSKKYENKEGNFVTGIDVTTEEEIKKCEERAKRFGLPKSESAAKPDLPALYKSLGLSEETVMKGERGIRLDALHIRGVDNMSTKDIFKYFQDFSPGGLEWLDDSSCNVVWLDIQTAARAMLQLSRGEEELPPSKHEERSNSKDDIQKTKEPSDVEMDESGDPKKTVATKPPRSDDHDFLDLNASDVNMETDQSETEDKSKMDATTSLNTTTVDLEHSIDPEKDSTRKQSFSAPVEIRENPTENIPWPPGKWRLGEPYALAKYIFLRYATKADKKIVGAEKRSKYYQKYGNPNYGGVIGLISNSRKRRYRQTQAKIEMDYRKEDEPPFEEPPQFNSEKRDSPNPDAEGTSTPVSRVSGDQDSEDEPGMEAELQMLLGSRQKHSMRMYADDVEEAITAKRAKETLNTINVTGVHSREHSNSPETIPTSDATDLRAKLRGRQRTNNKPRSGGGDLRVRLQNSKRNDDSKNTMKYPKMRIEVME